MKNPRIINSLLDNDLYKFTQQWAIMQKFPCIKVKYKFYMRSVRILPDEFVNELKEQVNAMKNIKLQQDEYDYIKSLRYLPSLYADFLKGYQYDPSEVHISEEDGNLSLEIEGLMYRTILWEVPLLALISELYFKLYGYKPDIEYQQRMISKFETLKHDCKFTDFGTRRRFSYDIQDELVRTFAEKNKTFGYKGSFMGTSNVYLAKKYNVKAIGTVAHEWFMLHGCLYGYKLANQMALDNWSAVYNGDLGVALPDTYTLDVFLRDFDMKHAKLWDGIRHDSGNPYTFANKIVEHYWKHNIDPITKHLTFSNAIDSCQLALDIQHHCDKIGIPCAFGIGTWFTNDVGVKPLNIVIKLDAVQVSGIWIPAVKLSDDKGKYTGDKQEIESCLYQNKISK